MRYPTLPAADAHRLGQEFLNKRGAERLENEIVWAGSGPEVELTPISELAATMLERLEVFTASEKANAKDTFEGRASAALHDGLHQLPILALDDPGFWRFLAFQYFWPLVVWRERPTFDAGDPAKYGKYLDGRNVTECVLTRMYLRGQLASTAGDYELASLVPDATDFWRSHITRVRTGTAPALAAAFIREQARERMATDELRDYPRRLNRLATNLVLPAIDQDDAESIIGKLSVVIALSRALST